MDLLSWAFLWLGVRLQGNQARLWEDVTVHRFRRWVCRTCLMGKHNADSGWGLVAGHRTCCSGSFRNHYACTGWGWDGTRGSNGDVEPGLRNFLSKKGGIGVQSGLLCGEAREQHLLHRDSCPHPRPQNSFPRAEPSGGGKRDFLGIWVGRSWKASGSQENRPWSKMQKRA